jgi:hypothetical protein
MKLHEAMFKFYRIGSIHFEARRFNHARWRQIWFTENGVFYHINFATLLVELGVTPKQLQDVFFPDCSICHHKPAPTSFEDDNLRPFHLSKEHFRKLAEFLGKVIHVERYDGSSGETYFLFTAYPPRGKFLVKLRQKIKEFWAEIKRANQIALEVKARGGRLLRSWWLYARDSIRYTLLA